MPTALDYAQNGYQLQKAGEFRKAIAYYDKALELASNLPGAHGCRGECYFKLVRYDAAVIDLTEEVRLSPGQSEWRKLLAQVYFQRGTLQFKAQNYDAAINDIRESACVAPPEFVANVNNELGRVYYVRAQRAFQQRHFDEALSDVRAAIELFPSQAGEWRQLEKNILWFTERPADSEESKQEAAAEPEPDRGTVSADAYAVRASVHQARNDLSAAFNDYTRAIQLAPGSGKLYRDRGSLYAATGNLDFAISDLTQALRLDPQLAETVNMLLADVYAHRAAERQAQGNLDLEYQDILAALALHPANDDVLREREQALIQEIRVENARTAFSQGQMAHQSDDFSGAEQYYTKAVQLDNDYLDVYLKRAKLRYAQRDYSGAVADYSEVIRLAPKINIAYQWRGWLYHALQNFDKALADYDQAISLDPKNAMIFSSRGRVYFDKGEYDKAVVDLDYAIRLNAKEVIAHVSRGDVFFAKGQKVVTVRSGQPTAADLFRKAIADYEQAVRLGVNDESLQKKLAATQQALAALEHSSDDRAIQAVEKKVQPRSRKTSKAKSRTTKTETTNIEFDDFDPNAQRILHLLEETNDCFFITGKAGTGKSTLLRYFVDHTQKETVLLAPTGIAALNVGGQTIHSFFRFPANFINKSDIRQLPAATRRLYEKVEVIIIDEVSMVRADMMDNIDEFMRKNGKDPSRPFGGVQLVLFGDLYQLPPVVKEEEEHHFLSDHYRSELFFDAHVFNSLHLKTEELGTVYRQRDATFVELLDAVRVNNISEMQLRLLNQQVSADSSRNGKQPFITLVPTNALAQEINSRQLALLATEEHTYIGTISGDFYDESRLPTDRELSLKVGAQVMFVRNRRPLWVNGTIGIVTDLNESIIKVEIPGQGSVDVTTETWEKIKYVYDREKGEITTEVVGAFTQYPLKLAWAITIHKSQGLTFDHVMIDMGYGAFANGQTYVALSRCTTLGGIHLRKAIRFSDVRADNRIGQFLQVAKTEKDRSQQPDKQLNGGTAKQIAVPTT